MFEEDVCGAVERVKTDFNPQIFITYKDVTYETFKDPEFCKVVEDCFGKDAVDRILSEKDVAPEGKRDQEGRR